MSTQATDARDMVKDLSQTVQNGCNTDAVGSSDKQCDAIMSTNEIGSQARAQYTEVMCGTKIATEA